jgi:hypothetical protein
VGIASDAKTDLQAVKATIRQSNAAVVDRIFIIHSSPLSYGGAAATAPGRGWGRKVPSWPRRPERFTATVSPEIA